MRTLLCQPFQQLLTPQTIAKICTIQFVKCGKADELVTDRDKIRIFLLANHADSAHHKIAELDHALKLRKQQVDPLLVDQLSRKHRLLDVIYRRGEILVKILLSGQPFLKHVPSVLCLLDPAFKSAYENTNPKQPLTFSQLDLWLKDRLPLLLHSPIIL